MNLKTLALSWIIVGAFCFSAGGQSPCQYWRSRVDTHESITDLSQIVDDKNPENVIPAIECLLKLEGNKNMSRVGLNPMPRLTPENQADGPVSILYTPTTIEVAALYMISYLYYQKWDHADWVELVNSKDQEVGSSEENVKKAYKYYREWFEQVKAIGIVKARELKIEPLKAKKVMWRTGK